MLRILGRGASPGSPKPDASTLRLIKTPFDVQTQSAHGCYDSKSLKHVKRWPET